MLILKNYPNNCSQRSEYYEANDQTFSISGFNIVLERHYEKYLWVEIVKQKIWDQDEGFVNSIQVHLLPPICTLRYHIMGQLSHSSWGEDIFLKTWKSETRPGGAGEDGPACDSFPRADQHLQQCDKRVAKHRGHDGNLILDVGSVILKAFVANIVHNPSK